MSDATVLKTHRSPFISDHAAVIAQLNIKKFTSPKQSQTTLKDIIADQWIQEFENQDLQLSDDFDVMVTSLNNTLQTVPNKLVPEKKIN